MSNKDWLQLIVGVVLVVAVVFCVCNTLEQKKVIDALNDRDAIQIQMLQYQADSSDELKVQLEEISNGINGVKSENDKFVARLDRLETLSLKEPETVEPVKPDLSVVENKIHSILSQIEQLEKDRITEADFNEWVKDLEKVIHTSLVEVSKPTPPVNPMPNITPTVQKVALSNEEKTAIVNRVKGEIFKQLEDANYGDFVDGKFVLRKAFFGARIYAGEEKDFLPTIIP